MPTYQYHCRKCGEVFERVEHIAEHAQAPHECPKCRSREVESVPGTFYAKTSKKS